MLIFPFCLVLKYLKNNYKFVSNLSKWVFDELVKINCADHKLLKALDIEDFEIIKLLIEFVKNKSSLDKYLFSYYYRINRNAILKSALFYRILEYDIKFVKLYDIVKLLIENCENINDNLLPLICERGHYELAKLLIENKGVKTGFEQALINADKEGFFDLVKLLVENGAIINSSCLINAANIKDYDSVKLFIENGADIHAQNDFTFICACKDSQNEIIKILIDKGANANAQNDLAFFHLYVRNNFDIIELLFKNGVNISANYYNLILVSAIIRERYDIIKLLLSDKNTISKQDNSAILKAFEIESIEVVKLFLDSGVKINSEILKCACKNGQYEIVKLLISYDPEVNTDYSLLEAGKHGYFNIVRLLIDNKANINIQNSYLVKYACKYNHIDIVKLFLNCSINDSMLLLAIKYGNLDIVKLLSNYRLGYKEENKIILKKAIKYNRESIYYLFE